jgi:hypothetical protein
MAFYPLQAIGVPLLLLVPIFALFGLLDTRLATKEVDENGLSLSIEYPSQLRYRTQDPFEISVRNETGHEITALEVRVSRDYLDGFHEADFNPDPKEIDADEAVFEMNNVGAGETRRVLVNFEADQVGNHQGTLAASTELGPGPRLEFSTFVLP